MPIEGVVADANVLLSAIVGKSALRVMTHFAIEVHVAEFNGDEVREYIPQMARKYKLPIELVRLQWKFLPVRFHNMQEYQPYFADALAALKDRDPEDAHVLALAKLLKLPIWSNDHDLPNQKVECYTTAKLLRVLQEQRKS